MPRKKKNGQSPARVPGLSHQGSSSSGYTGYRHHAHGCDGAMESNFPPSSASLPNSDKEKIVINMQEMFSHLDPEVIYIVLSECDFKVEHAMDSLLELSVAAEVAGPLPPSVSGFELTAAALLSPHHSEPDLDLSKPSSSPPSSPLPTSPLTEEFDLLIDQELKSLTTQPKVKEEVTSGQYFSAAASVSSFPSQALPELLQYSLEPGARGPSDKKPCSGGVALVEQRSEIVSPLDQLSFWREEDIKGQESVLDFSHLTSETPAAKPNPPLDLGASGRPSAFQVYKKQDQPNTGVMPSGGIVGGARSKANTVSREPPRNLSPSWNPEAPVFCPRVHVNQGPYFITPVALPPSVWDTQTTPASHWLGQRPVRQAPPKLSATIPKSWACAAAPRGPTPHNRLHIEGKVLVLLRGAPGSGKSTLARAMLEQNPGGVVLSTDDYFTHHGEYHFDPFALGEAHEWNHKRAKEAFESGANPIIIDNTNMQAWEMRPYVTQALRHNYKVLFREPDTWWKHKPRELVRRTKHAVAVERIRIMLEGYERFVSVQSIMGSQMPEWKRLQQNNRPSQPVTSDTPRPDLVGESGLAQGSEKSRPHVFSSLPDVSSIGPPGEMATPEHSSQNSAESLNLLPSEKVQEIPDDDEDMDMWGLDSELDAQLELDHPSGDQGIPDCIVESVLNEDHCVEELPVAFSESIGQRVRRERRSRKSDFDGLEPADLVKDTNQSGREAKGVEEKVGLEAEEAVGRGAVHDGGDKGRPELLDFVGDWPSDGGLEQRQARRREGLGQSKREEEEGKTKEAEYQSNRMEVRPGPDVTEFQKLLDLIQTGVDPSSDFALSSSSGEESEREGDARRKSPDSHGDKSNMEGRDQDMNRNDSSRAELPDCVLDWKVDDASVVREPPQSIMVESGGQEIKNRESSTREESDHMLEDCRETESVCLESKNASDSLSSLSADSLVTLEITEAKVSHDRREGHNSGGEVDAKADPGRTDKDAQNCTENDCLTGARGEAGGSHIGEVSHSPVCEVSVEAESSPLSGGTQERKQRQGRRSGKQCKLALTFTQNCPSSSPTAVKDSACTAAQNLNSSHRSTDSDVELNTNSECNLSLEPKTNFDLYPDPIPKPNPETQLQLHSPTPVVDTGCPTQTDPLDFALLWRLNRPDDTLVTMGDRPGNITVLSGDPSRFHPELSSAVSAAVAVHPSGHSEVPYHVMHEKGTQVEERELGDSRDRLDSLRILSRHFKLVSFDTLEDLYDKCHQDLEWTTNLLLDSEERFFRDEDGEEEEEDAAWVEIDGNTSTVCGALGVRSNALGELHPDDWPGLAGLAGGVEVRQESASGDSSSGRGKELGESADTDPASAVGMREGSCRTLGVTEKGSGSFGGALSQGSTNEDRPDERSLSPQPLLRAVNEGEEREEAKQEMTSATVGQEVEVEGGACSGSSGDGGVFEMPRDENEGDEMSSMDEVTRLLLAELEEMERREGDQKKQERKARRDWEERRNRHLDIQSVELKLPTELALQLTELFGPVGIDPGACSTDDYAVRMDLNLAKMLHQTWKDTIQERQRQAALSYHLLQESSVHWGESQAAKAGNGEGTQPAHFLIGTDGYASLGGQPEMWEEMPFMDHWSVSRPQVSLRDIMTEEQARQENMEKTRQSRADLDRRDGATLLKENQLYSLFPTIDRQFLQDIFRDHNYSLMETEQFLRSLLDEGPVKTVVAPEPPRSDSLRTSSKEREKKSPETIVSLYQDMEDPEYEDFRAEASLQRGRQHENFAKAAEAFKQGRKDVASFYAQRAHLHGQRMHEANRRAAVQIFERVNSSLLPRNILDLHGLHVDEALQHLGQVLLDKSSEYQQGLCGPQLSIITGRGNHSQGGVARIRPAVLDYLTKKHYRFTEPKPGLVLVSLN
ncbi:NEDD4-binding protein 2 isoform 2-T2 [Polymixia lowei]